MAGRKLVRDLFLHRQPLLLHSQLQVSGTKIRLLSENGYWGNRRFSVFNEFSKQVKEETNKDPQFKKTVKELKEQVEELKGVKEDLKVRLVGTTHGGSEMMKSRMQNEADNGAAVQAGGWCLDRG